jgi:hypothetical protein
MQRTGAGAHPYIENARTYVIIFHSDISSSAMNFILPIPSQAGTITESVQLLELVVPWY